MLRSIQRDRAVCATALLLLISIARWATADIVVEEIQDSVETSYGAHLDNGWVHFVVFSPEATEVALLLYDQPDATAPAHIVPMTKHESDWKIRVRGDGIGPGLPYMYRAKGAVDVSPSDHFGLMFNEHYPLNDPYAYDTQNVAYSAVFSDTPYVDASESQYAGGGKSIVYDHSRDPEPVHVAVRPEDLIVYELHVQDYTARIESLDDAKKRGTYVGLATSGLTSPGGLSAGIDHLVELGVTAVELMPIMEFDEETGNDHGRLNHWGYMTTNFFAPESRYASEAGKDVVELKQLVKAFHDRGIAVIIDAVHNHTGEGSPFVKDDRLAAKYYNLRGLSNRRFYKSVGDDRFYLNNSGTGNDVNFTGPEGTYPKRLATESLEMWHDVYGVDGFRFDLARILADGSHNAADWVDNDTDYDAAHLHAEPWDNGGTWFDFMDNYGYGHHNNRWAKWLGKYRDNVRQFSKSTLNNRTAFKRLVEGRGDTGGGPASTKPWRSVNILAVHDGYTLRDTVFFNDDGGSHNCWDSGGDENLRRERQKLMMGILLTSQGVPLIMQGDEFGQTKSGALSQSDAHNTYNYESTAGDEAINNVNWIDWRLKDGDNSESPNGPTYGSELFHWTKSLIELRKKWTHFRRTDFPEYASQSFNGGSQAGSANDGKFVYSFDGPSDGEPTQLAVIWWGKSGQPDLMVIYNEHHQPLTIDNLGEWSEGDWNVLARSWFGDDFDFCNVDGWENDCPAAGNDIEVEGRSVAILISDND